MGKSIIAIVAGFVVIALLSLGTDALLHAAMPQIFSATGRMESVFWLLVTEVYVFVFAVFGCWLAARLAPSHPMRHAMILGLLGLAFNVIGTIALWDEMPAWYHVVALALVLPAAWLGGWIRERQLRGAPVAGSPSPA
jgi:hypothetical protein